MATRPDCHPGNKLFKRTGNRFTAEELDKVISRVEGDMGREGREVRIKNVAGPLDSPGARHGALLMAIDITMADNVLRTSEREAIAEIAEGLGIEADVAADYVARMNQ